MLSSNEKVDGVSRRSILLPKVRVRGIYSTALTKLLLEHGFEVVQPSVAIRERFRLSDTIETSPQDLDIYDRLDWQGIYVVGETISLDALIQTLQSSLDDVIIRRGMTYSGTRQPLPTYWSKVSASTAEGARDTPLCPKRDFIDVEFPAASKKKLDDLRSTVMPTIEGHHHYKACGGKISSLLEMAENLLEKSAPRTEVEELFKESVRAEYPGLDSKIDIEHVKIDGRVFHLDNAKIADLNEEEGTLRLQRTFKNKGSYDGLRVRKDPDDYALTDLKIGSWTFQTSYFSRDGGYKGTYTNLNTPIEFYPSKIRYVDLEVDVCVWPDGKMEKIDLEKLEQRVSEGYISERLSNLVRAKLEETLGSIRGVWRNKDRE